jgi:hypothetical protein
MTRDNGTLGTRGTVGTAPLCHDLAELIESDPATVWTWGDREGPEASRPASSMAPVSPSPDHNGREKTFPPLETLEADQ